jgi:zinc protease
MKLLEQLTVRDLTSFYASQYQPQNVTLACVGDFDGGTFQRLARDTFGSWPRGTLDPLQRAVPQEPQTPSVRRASVELPVQTAYVLMGFSSTRLSDPDVYPLDVLANIAGQGRSSRLYEALVHQRQLAHAIAAWNYTPQDPGVFGIQLQTAPGQVDAATEAVLAVLEQIKQRGVTDEELRKAQRGVIANYLFGIQTVEAKAGDLADSLAGTGDPLFSRRYVARIHEVTRKQVQDAARRYCDPSRMTIAVIRPPADAAPDTAPPAVPQRPQLSKVSLENHATAIVGADRTLPISAIVVAFRGGVRVERDETQGTSNLLAQLLTKGTQKRSALEIAQQVESLGGTLEPFSGRDGFGIVLQLLAEDVEQGLALMHELVTQSTYPEEELRIQRELVGRQLQAQEDEIFDVGGRLLRRMLFGKHPYRFQPLGDKDVIRTITRRDVQDFARQWLTPSNMVMAVVGDIDTQAATRQLRRSFGAIAPATSAWPDRLPESSAGGIREASQVMDREQALVMLGFRGSTHTASDRYALDVLTAVLSGMAGRLFQAVREQHGLSYTLGAVHVPGWDPGYLLVYAATRPHERDRVLAALKEQLELVGARGFTEEEIEQAKRYLIGLHRLDLQHLVGLAKRSAIDELYGLGFDAWTTYESKMQAVTISAVEEAAKRYLTLGEHAQILVSPNGHGSAEQAL